MLLRLKNEKQIFKSSIQTIINQTVIKYYRSQPLESEDKLDIESSLGEVIGDRIIAPIDILNPLF